MQRPKHLFSVTTLLGLFFLISGLGKSLSIAQFTTLIANYGWAQLEPLAPLIISLEMMLGVAFLLRVHLRQTALLSIVFLSVLTLVFAYGYSFRGITSCGCFGAFAGPHLPAWVSFLRNLALIGLGGWLYRHAPVINYPEPRLRFGVVVAATGLAFIFSGSAYGNRYASLKLGVVRGQLVRTSLLAPYVPLGADSTYVIFVFSPTCPHCGDMTPTLASYKSSGIAARIIALHPPTDAQEEEQYILHFNPPFIFRNVARDSLYAITYSVPRAFVVSRGVVVQVLGPVMPSATELKSLLANKQLGRFF